MDKRIKNEVDEAVARAKEDPLPDESELWTNIYADNEQVPQRGTTVLQQQQ